MASSATIQTARADLQDASLYDEMGIGGVPKLTRAALLVPLSRAFDLAEGRRPGHAQRVAYVGTALAQEVGLEGADLRDVLYACILHDAGMSALTPRTETPKGRNGRAKSANELLATIGGGAWGDVLHALALHCEQGSKIVERLGFSENVARAVALHHDCWDGSGPGGQGTGPATPVVARIVAAADRLESMIDTETSPLLVRRKGPALVREMAGNELDPEIAAKLAVLAGRDSFWLGLYDNDISAGLIALEGEQELSAQALHELLGVLSDVVDARNGREVGRGRRVADLARQLTLRCDMTERRADLVKVAALLQDIGTLGIPAHVLSKPDILSIDEMSTIQQHPSIARDILGEIPGLGSAAWWVGCHHERVDGKGYPGMLEGDEVPVEAQVIGVCEAFAALTSDRPYRRAMAGFDAMEVLRGLAGTRFAPWLVERFEPMVRSMFIA